MKRSFDLAAYGDHVDGVVSASIGSTPESQITPAVLRQLLTPYVDELCEGLPTISELPSPEQVVRLAPSIGGVLLALRKAPTMRDIAEYTAASAADAAEIAIHALPNGMTGFCVGESDRLSLRQEFAPLELIKVAGLHTHPSTRAAGTEGLGVSLHAARAPSPADLDYARTMGPSAQYIADSHGLTYFTSIEQDVPAEAMIALALPDLRNASDAAIESIHYPAAAATISDIQVRSWADIDPALTMHDFVAHSSFYTGDIVAQNVFAAAPRP